MRRTLRRRALVVVPLLLVLTVSAGAVLASEEETTTTAANSSGPIAQAPAVEVVPSEAEPEDLPWTAIYLYPALIALAVLIIGGLTLYYFTRIKGRYRVVER